MWIFHSIYLILWFCRISETVINTIIGLVSGYPDPDTNNNNNNHIRLCAAALVSEFLGLWGGGGQEGWGWWRGWWWWCQYHPSGKIINVLFKGCLKKIFYISLSSYFLLLCSIRMFCLFSMNFFLLRGHKKFKMLMHRSIYDNKLEHRWAKLRQARTSLIWIYSKNVRGSLVLMQSSVKLNLIVR